VRGVVIHRIDSGSRENPQRRRERRSRRQRTGERDVIDIGGLQLRDLETRRDRGLRYAGPGAAGELRFLHGRRDLTIADDGCGCVSEDSTNSEDIHLARFSIFA